MNLIFTTIRGTRRTAFWFLFFSLLYTRPAAAQFVKGADVGWLSQMEATGYSFYDSTGTQKNCLQILKDKGINTLRLRVWVNPSNDRINGHCSKKEVAAMALRAKTMGMRLMIDFHYSDSWADPAKQTKPAAWANHSFQQLLNDVYEHTYSVLDTLKQLGVTPDWAQTGNEIISGMLWPDGKVPNWTQLAQLLNKGYDAIKAVDSSILSIIHIDQGNDNGRSRWFFDNIRNQNVHYDVIGLSYYPYWLGTDYTVTIEELGNNLADMVARYGKPVMVVEVGGDYTKVENTYNMLVAVLNKVKAVPGDQGLGVIYWEPQGEKSWSGYQLSCWGPDKRPTAALNAFSNAPAGIKEPGKSSGFRIYPNPAPGGVINIELTRPAGEASLKIYDLTGRMHREIKLTKPYYSSLHTGLLPGLYLVNIESGDKTVQGNLLSILD